MSALQSQMPCCYFLFFLRFSFFIFLFHFIFTLFPLYFLDQTKTLKQRAEWSSLVINYFIPKSDLKSRNYSFSNYANHCSEAVCTLLLHAASAVTAVACLGPADTWDFLPSLEGLNTLTSRRLPAPRCSGQTSQTQTVLLFFRNWRM